MLVSFTVDYEPDCPPYMTDTFRGVEEGTGPLLDMLHREGVPTTFFSTGAVAERYPGAIAAIVADGHELGCHGHTHRKFTELAPEEARGEIETSAAVLRRHAPVTSFRAPNLVFPDAYLRFLEGAGFALDSSQARYKAAYWSRGRDRQDPGRLARIPASVTSSVLRLPRVLREAYLSALSEPVVLFVHPWEFVDLRHTDLRLDCRFNTGEIALRRVREVLRYFGRRGARFVTMRELAAQAPCVV
jgi:peptidoglycan/xylan/chitin deacetylase (PgdA/CDA1 family)